MQGVIAGANGFADWACDPKRSIEERFGAELLIELTTGLWNNKHGIKTESNYEAERLRKQARALDPGHEPQYSRESAEHTEEVLPELKQLHFGYFDDRPLRSLAFLRFCPSLESIETRFSEIPDWTPLLTQTTVTKLHVWDRAARALRPVGRLTKLNSLMMWLGAPWPDLTGLEKLAELREFNFQGNIHALQAVPSLAQVRIASIKHGNGYNLPLRNVAAVPVMPELRRLMLDNTAELDGIERYDKLLNLEIYGHFTDVRPLASLKNLTHLTLSGGDYPTVAPLAQMPQLCRLVVRHEVPPDFTPLAEAARLHEIVTEATHIVPPELASLNAMFNSWDEEFAAAKPRPLVPLTLSLRDSEPHSEMDSGGTNRDLGDDLEMDHSEHLWFARRINRRLTALLGKGWGQVQERFARNAGYEQVTISRPEDIDRLLEVVQCLRELIAAARHPWSYLLIVDSLARFERDMDEIYRDDDAEFDPDRQREEWEDERRQERERREFLDRKYRHRLQQELGSPGAPPKPAAAPTNETGEDDQDMLTTTAEASESEYDLGTRIQLFVTLTEKAGYIHESYRDIAELLLEMKAEG